MNSICEVMYVSVWFFFNFWKDTHPTGCVCTKNNVQTQRNINTLHSIQSRWIRLPQPPKKLYAKPCLYSWFFDFNFHIFSYGCLKKSMILQFLGKAQSNIVGDPWKQPVNIFPTFNRGRNAVFVINNHICQNHEPSVIWSVGTLEQKFGKLVLHSIKICWITLPTKGNPVEEQQSDERRGQ